MPDLAALAQTARELTEQIQLLQRQQATRAAAEEERDQMEQIVSIAKRHSIRGHVLEKMDEHQRGLYTTALCSIVNKSSNLEARTGRLVYIGRLLASCGREALLNEGLTRSLRLDAQFIADFVEQIRDSHREAFTVDAVVLCHLAGETEDTMLKAAAEYISLLELKDEAVGRCARLATAILAQSAEQFWAVPGADLYIGYMSGWRDCVTAEDLPSVKDRKGTLVFVRQTFQAKLDERLELDEYAAEHFVFIDCTFLGSTAIWAQTKTVDCIDCMFNGSEVDNKTETEKENSDYRGRHRNVSQPLLLLSSGTILHCKFRNYYRMFPNNRGRWNDTYDKSDLLSAIIVIAQNGILESCDFQSLVLSDVPLVWLGIGGRISRCRFDKCTYEDEYSLSPYWYRRIKYIDDTDDIPFYPRCQALVSLFYAEIENTVFTTCRRIENRYDETYILGLYASSAKEVQFEDCGPSEFHTGEVKIGPALSHLM